MLDGLSDHHFALASPAAARKEASWQGGEAACDQDPVHGPPPGWCRARELSRPRSTHRRRCHGAAPCCPCSAWPASGSPRPPSPRAAAWRRRTTQPPHRDQSRSRYPCPASTAGSSCSTCRRATRPRAVCFTTRTRRTRWCSLSMALGWGCGPSRPGPVRARTPIDALHQLTSAHNTSRVQAAAVEEPRTACVAQSCLCNLVCATGIALRPAVSRRTDGTVRS